MNLIDSISFLVLGHVATVSDMHKSPQFSWWENFNAYFTKVNVNAPDPHFIFPKKPQKVVKKIHIHISSIFYFDLWFAKENQKKKIVNFHITIIYCFSLIHFKSLFSGKYEENSMLNEIFDSWKKNGMPYPIYTALH